MNSAQQENPYDCDQERSKVLQNRVRGDVLENKKRRANARLF